MLPLQASTLPQSRSPVGPRGSRLAGVPPSSASVRRSRGGPLAHAGPSAWASARSTPTPRRAPRSTPRRPGARFRRWQRRGAPLGRAASRTPGTPRWSGLAHKAYSEHDTLLGSSAHPGGLWGHAGPLADELRRIYLPRTEVNRLGDLAEPARLYLVDKPAHALLVWDERARLDACYRLAYVLRKIREGLHREVGLHAHLLVDLRLELVV